MTFSRRGAALTGVLAGLVLALPSLATILPPGGSLTPPPLAFIPSGTTIASGSTPFTLRFSSLTPPFLNLTTTGEVAYSVIRLPDNTLTFTYTVTNDDTSDTVINHFSVNSFASFTTDVNAAASFVTAGDRPDSATRTADGGTIVFTYDLGFIQTARTVWVKTNATSFSRTGHATLSMFPNGNGSATIGRIPRPVVDSTPPTVSITSPSTLADVCNPVPVIGSANDTGGFDGYTLEFSASPNGPWTTIASPTTPVTGALLGSWSTTGLSQGYYFLRVVARNTSDLESVATTVVFVDKQFDTVEARSPRTGQILGGTVCFDGTVTDPGFSNYRIDYAPLPAGAPFQPVSAGTPTYGSIVLNDPLGSWSTASGPTAVADGAYRVRVLGSDQCGFTRSVTRDIIIDNTPPTGRIDFPQSCSPVSGVVQVRGVATDAHMGAWTLQFVGGDAHTWTTIATGNSNVTGVLGLWNTSGLRPCAYALRLVVADATGVNCSDDPYQVEYVTLVNVGGTCNVDFNFDGNIDPDDLSDYIAAYFGGCP